MGKRAKGSIDFVEGRVTGWRVRATCNGQRVSFGLCATREEAEGRLAAALQQIAEQESGDREVYFIRRSRDDFIKIGVSMHPEKRMRAIMMAAGVPMTMLGAVRGGFGMERGLHHEFRHLRAVGEWFRPEDDLLRRVYELTGWRPRYTDRLWKAGRYDGLEHTGPAPLPRGKPRADGQHGRDGTDEIARESAAASRGCPGA